MATHPVSRFAEPQTEPRGTLPSMNLSSMETAVAFDEPVPYDKATFERASSEAAKLADSADPSLASVDAMTTGQMLAPVDVARCIVTYSKKAQESFSITEENADNYLGTFLVDVPVYDPNVGGDHYVAVLDINRGDPDLELYDWTVIYDNNNGEVIEDATMKDGVVYIPKHVFEDPQGSPSVSNGVVAMQADYAFKGEMKVDEAGNMDLSKGATVTVLDGKAGVQERYVRVPNLFESSFAVSGFDRVEKGDVAVYLNGSLVPMHEDAYEIVDGALLISESPGKVGSVTVAVKEMDFLSSPGTTATALVTPEPAHAVTKVKRSGAVQHDEMDFMTDEDGNEIIAQINAANMFVGWRGVVENSEMAGAPSIDPGLTTPEQVLNAYDDLFSEYANFVKEHPLWFTSIKHMYGGWSGSSGAHDGYDHNYVSSARWAIASYAIGTNSNKDFAEGVAYTANTDVSLKVTRDGYGPGDSLTIYEWMVRYSEDLKKSNAVMGITWNTWPALLIPYYGGGPYNYEQNGWRSYKFPDGTSAGMWSDEYKGEATEAIPGAEGVSGGIAFWSDAKESDVTANNVSAVFAHHGMNGLAGWNNFAFRFPKTIAGNGTNLVSTGRNAGRPNESVTFKFRTEEEGQIKNRWLALACTHGTNPAVPKNPDKQPKATSMYMTCIGMGADYVVFAFATPYAPDAHQEGFGIYKFRLATTKLDLEKSPMSDYSDYVKDNENYSLEDARYYLFERESDADNANTMLDEDWEANRGMGEGKAGYYAKCTFQTDDKGKSSLKNRQFEDVEGSKIANGIYYVVEAKPSKGYARQSGVTKVDLCSTTEDKYTIELEEPPLGGVPRIYKSSKNTGKPLANAVYKVTWYAGNYTSESEIPAKAYKRTWTFKTKADGYAKMNENFKEGGDDLPKLNGKVLIPFGTFIVTETSAPPGYREPDVKTQGPEPLNTEIEMDNKVFRYVNEIKVGHISLHKVDNDTKLKVAQGDATLAGAVLDVTLVKKAYPNADIGFTTPSGKDVGVGDVICQIKTADDGKASTKASNVNGWSWPSEQAGLPYGTYKVTESKASKGYRLPPNWSVTVTLSDDTVSADNGYVFDVAEKDYDPEPVITGKLLMNKVDHDLFSLEGSGGIPLVGVTSSTAEGDASLAGAEFKVYNVSKSYAVVNGQRYETLAGADGTYTITDSSQACATLTTNAKGEVPALTLPYGTYVVRETKAPQGYDVNPKLASGVKFTIRTQDEVANLGDLSIADNAIAG